MCGLVGFWQFKEVSEEYLKDSVKTMATMIHSRGPDSYGSWTQAQHGLVLGHKRLSIIDLSAAGHQPMMSHNKRYVIAYNGEIYNSAEIAKDLEINFRGHSDTEVLLEACSAWGVERAVQRANGMFAFALWDSQDKCLYLVRDRLGIKPLYWGFNNGILFFGSTVGGFTRHRRWQSKLNSEALSSYFQHNYIRGPHSIYEGVEQVRPGVIVKINQDKIVKQQPFWRLDDVVSKSQISQVSEAELEEELDSLLRDAVKSRMVSDVPLGSFLSGGIDSSTVTALMQQQSNQPIKTFSIGFNEADFNEAHHAKKVAEHLGTEHYEHYFSAKDAIDLIPSLATWYDEPFADSSQLPTYLVSKVAREHVTVALSGDGGDELFAGYNRYVMAESLWKKIDVMPKFLRKGLTSGINSLSSRQIEVLAKLIPGKLRPNQIADKAYKFASVISADRQTFYKNLVSLWGDEQLVLDQGFYDGKFPKPSKQLDYISEMQFIDTLTYLPDDILTKVDRASMAISLEARVPLLDYRVVEFAWNLPMQQKLQGTKGKLLLRRVLNRYVPELIIDRPKMGFGVPIGDWLRGPLKDWGETLLSDSNLNFTGLLNTAPIKERWKQHQAGERNWQYPLWGVLQYLAWQQLYLS